MSNDVEKEDLTLERCLEYQASEFLICKQGFSQGLQISAVISKAAAGSVQTVSG